MYEAVHATPDGDATVSRHALTAADLGYGGVVVRNHGDAPASYDADLVAAETGVDVVDGIEVRTAQRGQAASLVSRFRDEYTVVCVHGGDRGVNRYAVEEPAVDVLSHPMQGEGDVNHVLAKAAAENGVRLEFDFSPVLQADGGPRVQAIMALRKLHEMVEQYDTPYVVSATPTSHLGWRGPRELGALGAVCGFDPSWTRHGLGEWGRIVERNRERFDPTFVEPGVRRGQYDGSRGDR